MRTRRADGRHWTAPFMTKFESCAKGADRRGAVVAEDVLLGDAYDVPDDGVGVDAKTG